MEGDSVTEEVDNINNLHRGELILELRGLSDDKETFDSRRNLQRRFWNTPTYYDQVNYRATLYKHNTQPIVLFPRWLPLLILSLYICHLCHTLKEKKRW